MAGMEQLEIHSKSYLIRWVDVAAYNTISWSLQPHRKSISFGIVKHNGNSSAGADVSSSISTTTTTAPGKSPRLGPTSVANTAVTALNSTPAFAIAGTPLQSPHASDEPEEHTARKHGTSVSTPRADAAIAAQSAVMDKLEKLGMRVMAWAGKCEADRVAMGRYSVLEGESGMYGLVFDNTQAKAHSKTVTFVLMTYPSAAPPKSMHQLPFSTTYGNPSKSDGNLQLGNSPGLRPISDSAESLIQLQDLPTHRIGLMEARPGSSSGQATEYKTSTGTSYYTGVLSKKRRKRNQGYARRFFSLDFTSSTLSYYKNRNSSALRGAIPLSLAAIGVDEKSRTISVDSGSEIWLLKAHNQKDFSGWRSALDRASKPIEHEKTSADSSEETLIARQAYADPAANHEWERVEGLVGKVAGITDAVRRLAKDTDPKYSPTAMTGLGINTTDGGAIGSTRQSPGELQQTDYFQSQEKSSRFWKRKSSAGAQSPSGVFRRSFSNQKTPTISSSQTPASLAVPSPTNNTLQIPKRHSFIAQQGSNEDSMHDHCMSVLRDLDAVVAEFSSLVTESRQRRIPQVSRMLLARRSTDTTVDEEFFDAEDRPTRPRSQLLDIARDSDNEQGDHERDDASAAGDSDASSDDEGPSNDYSRTPRAGQPSLFPVQASNGTKRSLYPLPRSSAIARRSTIHKSPGPPPSLISFLRKNVGKDLSTISTPVAANEPLSLLQRQAEFLEHSSLLTTASTAASADGARILYIAAFAISTLSNSRAKERATRKPFNPMLGETFELVREDLGFRFLAEKITHRPVRVASQAEHAAWTYLHAPTPTQKFWGKSVELAMEGRVRVALHGQDGNGGEGGRGERYSWAHPTEFLRNIIAGEKYVEPVGSLTVVQETSGGGDDEDDTDSEGATGGRGRKAVVTFKSGGMFSGRSEEVTVQAFEADGTLLPLGLQGKWTTSLSFTGTGVLAGKEIWTAGSLVEQPGQHFGFTKFAAQMNEITELEDGALCPTDSRLRPDQRAYEDGDETKAEELKKALEEAQRRRRKALEDEGGAHEVRWFEEVGREGEESIWRLKEGDGKEGYWDVRRAVTDLKHGRWDGVREVFEVD